MIIMEGFAHLAAKKLLTSKKISCGARCPTVKLKLYFGSDSLLVIKDKAHSADFR